MLSKASAVTTIAVTDLERAKGFYGGIVGLIVLDETPFAVRNGTARGSQLSVRRGTPNIHQTVVHFEIDDIGSAVKELSERGVWFEGGSTQPRAQGPEQAKRQGHGWRNGGA